MHDKILIFISLLLLLLQLSSSETFPINIWPIPTTMSWPSLKATRISSSFQILSPYSHKHLRVAVKRYSRRLLSEHYLPIIDPHVNPSAAVQLSSLTLTIADAGAALRHGVDESYNLSVSSTCADANLTSETVWGAIRGLESFSQLAWGSPPMIACDVRVYDEPKFAYRGVLLDTARNYYPVKDILRTIRAMGENKLNVFHWHLTDSQSFPIQLPSEPDLAKKGAYGDHMKYSPEDVKRIVEYAMSFGVRVMPEIDAPAHAGSWAGAYPDIVTCANKFWLPNGTGDWANRYASEPGTGHLNPLLPKTYQVLHNVLRDVTSLFPDSFYHGGADEIIPGCWKADPTIQSFLSTNKNATLNQVLELFICKTHPLIVSANRTAVYYEDVLLDQNVHVSPAALPPSTTILQTWNGGPNNTKLLVGAGYRTIVSSADFYYLDCGHGDFTGNDSAYEVPNDIGTNGESWCGPFKTWQRIYDYDIIYGLSEEEAGLVLGGEVALWSEQADPTVLDARVWPRASALAESMWSGNRDENGRKRSPTATDRLMDWRHRMVGRGIMAEPIQPLWCRTNPGMCNLNE